MDEIIKLSRELTEHYFNNDDIKLKKEHYYILVLARFVFFKEAIVKKAGDKILYFDDITNKDYIDAIKNFSKEVKKTCEYQMNEYQYKFETNLQDKKFEEDLWLFNKVRDSIVHGMFQLDFKNKKIIINNDHTKDNNPYKLEGTIDLSLLNTVVEIIDTDQTYNYSNERHELKKLNLYDEKFLNDYNYLKAKKLKLSGEAYVTKNIIFVVNYPSNIINYKDPRKRPIINFNKNTGQISISKKDLKKLDRRALLDIKMFLELYAPTDENINKIIDEEILKLEKTINIDKETPLKINNAVITLYAYAMFVFAREKPIDYSHLCFNHTYINFDLNDQGSKEDYENRKTTIRNICQKFIKKENQLLNSYNKCQEKDKNKIFVAMLKPYKEFCEELVVAIGKKNELIVTSLRNAVDHNNCFSDKIEGPYEVIVSHDQKDHSKKEIKFMSMMTPEYLFEIIKNIDLNNSTYTEDMLFYEIKDALEDNNLYQELVNIIDQIDNLLYKKNTLTKSK